MTVRKQAIYAGATLFVAGLVVLFWGLGDGRMHIYDEGLYGMYGRTLLRYGVLLHAVDIHGEFPSGLVKFSKPPLSVWLVAASMKLFGPSLFALRLPFALASLAVALVSFAFGRLVERGARGVWLGFTWGSVWLVCYGTYEHGRTATIEPMLLAFVIAALYAYARALGVATGERDAQAQAQRPASLGLGWAAWSGLAISGAFFTKQLVCALAVVPIIALELWGPRTPGRTGRLGLSLGIPALLAGGWFGALYQRVGFTALKVLWSHAIVRRVAGFDGVHHQNYLNRVAELLDTDASPFSWPLGLLGLGLAILVIGRQRSPGRHAAWALGLYFACAFLAFDVGSRAILPWYALTLMPPLALGQAWLLVCAADWALAIGRGAGHGTAEALDAAAGPARLPSPEALTAFAAAGGGVAFALATCAAARSFMPSALALALAGGLIVLCLRPRGLAPARLRLAMLAFGGVLAIGTFSRDGYRSSEADPLAELGRRLYARGVTRVSVDSKADVHDYTLATFFGPDAKNEGAPPWDLAPVEAAKFQARVEPGLWPNEIIPRKGVWVERGAGLLAWVGDMTQAPFGQADVPAALERGGLTFEAEHMGSARLYTAAGDADASGARVRRAEQRLLERASEFALAEGVTPQLPRGRYVAEFWLKLRCTGYRGESLGVAAVNAKRSPSKRKPLDCRAAKQRDGDVFSAVEVPFTLNSLARAELELRWSQGSVSLDRVVVRRDRSVEAAK